MGIRYPFVDVSIGDINITQFLDNVPDTLVDFSFSRTTYYSKMQSGSKFNITLYDDTAIDVEDILSWGGKLNVDGTINETNTTLSMNIRYGWCENGAEIPETVSEIPGMYSKYTLSFEGIGVTLAIEGMVTSYAEACGHISSGSYSSDEYEGKQSKVVEAICAEEGWEIGYIEPTTAKLNDDGSIFTFNRTAMKSGEFCNSLCEDAESEESGEKGYRFFMGEDGKIYFFASNNTSVGITEASEELTNQLLNTDDVDGTKVQNVQGTQPGISTDTTYSSASRYWVGDSRFVGMVSYMGSIDVMMSEVGGNYSWFENAYNQLNAKLKNEAGEVVILGLGVNDLSNVDKYISGYRALMASKPNVKFIAVSVNPVYSGGTTTVTNTQIEEFNSKMRDAFPDKYLNIYDQIRGSVTKASTDTEGVHYSGTLAKRVYDKISNAAGNSSQSSRTVNYSSTDTSASGIEISGTYEYYSGRTDNTVISFSPEYSGLCAAQLSNSSSYSIDAVKNEMMECRADRSSLETFSSGRIMGLSASSYNTLKTRSISMWNALARQQYNATMEIIGDATIKIGTYIYVAVYTKYGLLHHTSGVYFIKSAEDSITGGIFTTTLTLEKHGTTASDVSAYEEESISGTVSGTATGATGIGRQEVLALANKNGTGDIVDIALGEIGNSEPTGDDKYISWYGGFSLDVAWCAIFVSWCANQAGIPTTSIPKYASVQAGLNWFRQNGTFKARGEYIPKRGDIFIQKSGGASHTGIVVSCDGTNYVTIEGNCSSAVKSITRSLSDSTLTGFGVWQ